MVTRKGHEGKGNKYGRGNRIFFFIPDQINFFFLFQRREKKTRDKTRRDEERRGGDWRGEKRRQETRREEERREEK